MYSDVLCSKYTPARLRRDLHTREEMLEFKLYRLDIEKTVNTIQYIRREGNFFTKGKVSFILLRLIKDCIYDT